MFDLKARTWAVDVWK